MWMSHGEVQKALVGTDYCKSCSNKIFNQVHHLSYPCSCYFKKYLTESVIKSKYMINNKEIIVQKLLRFYINVKGDKPSVHM